MRAGRNTSYNNFEIPEVSGLSNIYLLFKWTPINDIIRTHVVAPMVAIKIWKNILMGSAKKFFRITNNINFLKYY
jgi:hypothetical protein